MSYPIAAHSALSCQLLVELLRTGSTGTSMTMEGFESARAFDDIQVRNGMFIEQGGNNHSYENNNGIRYYDPATNTTGYIEPWLKSAPFVQGLVTLTRSSSGCGRMVM